MANEYYDHNTFPVANTRATSSGLRTELDAVETGFDKMPVLAGNGNKFVKVNAGGTALEPVALTISGSNTGDQTSIVGITGTIAQFNTALTDGDFATGGGTATGTNTGDNAVNSLYSGLVSNATHTGEVTGATALTIANDAVTYAKMQNVSATDRLLGRVTAGAGDVEEITCTAAGRALLDDATASDQRTTLGLGSLATQSGTFSGTSSGTNTGDQNLFSTIAVSGQSNVVADATSDTLTLVAGSNVTITTNAATDEITINAASGGAGATNLGYTASTRILTSDTGTDVTLPLMSSTDAGLVPASGGGTANFLRADGTFAAPSGGGGSPSYTFNAYQLGAL